MIEASKLCIIDRDARTITFHVRENFGNGKDRNGLKFVDPDIERKEALRLFENALGCLMTGAAGGDYYSLNFATLPVSDKIKNMSACDGRAS